MSENSHKPRSAKHALVVGGTGMLRGVSLELAKNGYVVSVIARSQSNLQMLVNEAKNTKGQINPISLDYRVGISLKEGIENAIKFYGVVSLAVVWIHRIAPGAPEIVSQLVGDTETRCSFFHIRGSSALSELSKLRGEDREKFTQLPNLSYHEVILGYIKENGTVRWLTNEEISIGILKAIHQLADVFVVGNIDAS